MADKQITSKEDRFINLVERIGAAFLYSSTDMGQTDIAKVLGIGNSRVNEILKNVKKQK